MYCGWGVENGNDNEDNVCAQDIDDDTAIMLLAQLAHLNNISLLKRGCLCKLVFIDTQRCRKIPGLLSVSRY